MKDILNDIREKTEGMSRQDKVSYILTYYWYHMLIIFSVLALIVIFIVHYATYKKPEFTCVMVNQQIDTQRDNQMTEEYAKFSKMDPKRIEINSNYNFSYGDLKLADVNESSNEKFFLQWRNNELDAVIMTESFYEYCKEVGGELFPSNGRHEKASKLYLEYILGGNACLRLLLSCCNSENKMYLLQ